MVRAAFGLLPRNPPGGHGAEQMDGVDMEDAAAVEEAAGKQWHQYLALRSKAMSNQRNKSAYQSMEELQGARSHAEQFLLNVDHVLQGVPALSNAHRRLLRDSVVYMETDVDMSPYSMGEVSRMCTVARVFSPVSMAVVDVFYTHFYKVGYSTIDFSSAVDLRLSTTTAPITLKVPARHSPKYPGLRFHPVFRAGIEEVEVVEYESDSDEGEPRVSYMDQKERFQMLLSRDILAEVRSHLFAGGAESISEALNDMHLLTYLLAAAGCQLPGWPCPYQISISDMEAAHIDAFEKLTGEKFPMPDSDEE